MYSSMKLSRAILNGFRPTRLLLPNYARIISPASSDIRRLICLFHHVYQVQVQVIIGLLATS
jgi:hypothetical protein